MFDKLNLVVGPVGSGKSTATSIAIRFCLYGASDSNLANLRNKWSKEPCFVEIRLIDRDEHLCITREIPTKVTILLKGEEVLPGALNRDKDAWLEERFGTLKNFEKFRMIDTKLGSNLLELGATELRRTLLEQEDNLFNRVRANLVSKKTEFDKYNREDAKVDNHYPSEKRLNFLRLQFESLKLNFQDDREDKAYSAELTKTLSAEAYLEAIIDQECKYLKLLDNRSCPVCTQEFRDAETLRKGVHGKIDAYKAEMTLLNDKIDELEALGKKRRDKRTQNLFKLNRIERLIHKLEGRIKQKEYRYTGRDVEEVSYAIRELDNYYSQYLVESLNSLQPIINNIVNKINLSVFFVVKDGKISIELERDQKQFSYKELSSGQKMILNIAFQVAALLQKGQEGLIVADEGFSNLDSDSIITLYDLFRDLPFQLISVIHRFNEETDGIKIIRIQES